MRHRKAGRKLGRNASHRGAMMRNMVTSLFELERIQTTEPKAKELRRVAEKLITAAKHNAASVVAAASDADRPGLEGARLAAVRQAARVIRTRDVLQKLFGDLAERYLERPGGYTRILRVGRRVGDGADMVILELVDRATAGPAGPEQGEGDEAEQAAS